MALVWLVCTLINKPMPRNIEIAIALTFLIIALYQAWEEKNKQYIALKELLESSDISLQMNSFSSGQDADGQPVFFVGGLLYNKGGRPSGLINWNIAIEFPNGDKIMGAMPPAPYKDLTVTLWLVSYVQSKRFWDYASTLSYLPTLDQLFAIQN